MEKKYLVIKQCLDGSMYVCKPNYQMSFELAKVVKEAYDNDNDSKYFIAEINFGE